jgi:chemotaxis protein CheD
LDNPSSRNVAKISITYNATIPSVMLHEQEEIRVNMACMKVGNTPQWLVATVGSCVAVCLFDGVKKCGGMAHIMLPSGGKDKDMLPYKYADTAVPALVESLQKMGCEKTDLVAKIAGGANMFYDQKIRAVNVGSRNVEAVKKSLACHDIPLVASDVGGFHGRRVSFNVFTGIMVVKSFNGEKIL